MTTEENLQKIRIGKPYRTETASGPENYLNISLRAEKFIAKYAHEDKDGIYWKKRGATWSMIGEQEVDQSFYSGTSGILYYYLKLWETTKEEKFMYILKEGTRYLAAHWKEYFEQSPIFGMKEMDDGLYMGVGGIGLVFSEIYRSIQNENAKQGALEIESYYINSVKHDENGAFWTGSPAIAMDGGVILLLLRLYHQFGSEETKKVLLKAAERYIKQGIPTEKGGLEFRGWPGPGTRPNYEFGSAGAGYLLTLLYEFTKDEKYLDAAKKCTVYLSEIRIQQEKGYLIPYDTETDTPFYFLSSCHGVGGNAKLYYKLYRITGNRKYLDDINAMIDGIESMRAPEKQSVGLWNTQCFCCGHAGMLQFFLGLYESVGEPQYLDLARRTAAVLLGEREDQEDGTTLWSMAFWRVKPDFLTVDLGYYDGIAGIASVLLQMYLAEIKQFHWSRLPDDPFAESGKE